MLETIEYTFLSHSFFHFDLSLIASLRWILNWRGKLYPLKREKGLKWKYKLLPNRLRHSKNSWLPKLRNKFSRRKLISMIISRNGLMKKSRRKRCSRQYNLLILLPLRSINNQSCLFNLGRPNNKEQERISLRPTEISSQRSFLQRRSSGEVLPAKPFYPDNLRKLICWRQDTFIVTYNIDDWTNYHYLQVRKR